MTYDSTLTPISKKQKMIKSFVIKKKNNSLSSLIELLSLILKINYVESSRRHLKSKYNKILFEETEKAETHKNISLNTFDRFSFNTSECEMRNRVLSFTWRSLTVQ